MAALRHLEDHQRVETLPTRCLIGRSRSCDLQLTAGDISSQHAVVQWTGRQWELQDLASRNGTFIDEHRLAQGERAPLRRGSRLRFARQLGGWELLDDGPPEPMARNIADGRICVGDHGFLAIPDVERPELTLQTESSGRWVLERSGELTDVVDRTLLLVGSEEWRIYLPGPPADTLDEGGQGLCIADLRLRFAHSADEETIELVAFAGERRIDLKARAHHYPLLLLARARVADEAQGVPLADQGWLLQERLLGMLRIDVMHLNISIHRSRMQFAQAGVVDAARHAIVHEPGRKTTAHRHGGDEDRLLAANGRSWRHCRPRYHYKGAAAALLVDHYVRSPPGIRHRDSRRRAAAGLAARSWIRPRK